MEQPLYERIRLMRLTRGLSQQDVSRELGISTGAYSNIETGKTELTLSRVQHLAHIFRMDFVALVDPAAAAQKQLHEGGQNFQQVKNYEKKIGELEQVIENQKKEIAYLQEIIALMKVRQAGGKKK